MSVAGRWRVFTGRRNVSSETGDPDEIRAGFDLVKILSLYESCAPSVCPLYSLVATLQRNCRRISLRHREENRCVVFCINKIK